MRFHPLMNLILAPLFFFVASVALAAECPQTIKEASELHLVVNKKIKKMKRLHMAKKMMSMQDMRLLDKDMKQVKMLIGEASALCETNKDKAASNKAMEAIALAKTVEHRHNKTMKMGSTKKMASTMKMK